MLTIGIRSCRPPIWWPTVGSGLVSAIRSFPGRGTYIGTVLHISTKSGAPLSSARFAYFACFTCLACLACFPWFPCVSCVAWLACLACFAGFAEWSGFPCLACLACFACLDLPALLALRCLLCLAYFVCVCFTGFALPLFCGVACLACMACFACFACLTFAFLRKLTHTRQGPSSNTGNNTALVV